MVIAAENDNQKDLTKLGLFVAWHTAMYERQPRLPDITKVLLIDEDESEEELEARIMAWAYSHNARYNAAKMLGIAED